MKKHTRFKITGLIFAAGALLLPGAKAQEKSAASATQQNRSYNVAREVSLQGQVTSFTAKSSVAPLGAHVTLQSSAGPVDVHLGDARLLSARKITLAPGDNIRIIGEVVTSGRTSQFVARLLVKGTQQVILRTNSGFPVKAGATSPSADGAAKGGVL